MADRRSYQQFCGLARALDVLGERWTLLLVREMLLAPRRYSDLLENLPGLTTNLLARRLKQLEADGLIEKTLLRMSRLPAYQLTARGRLLEPVILELGRWGGGLMDAPTTGDRLDIAWGLISLKRRFLGGRNFRMLLEIDERQFSMSFEDDYLNVMERPTDLFDLRIRGSEESFRQWLFMGIPLGTLEADGRFEIEGAERARARVLRAFDDLA